MSARKTGMNRRGNMSAEYSREAATRKMPDLHIRPATESDQATIRQMVQAEHLDPTSIRWQNFLLAEHDGRVVGIGQIRPYPNCPELGSLVVHREFQGQGIGGMLIEALLTRESGVVYLECRRPLESYYSRFGFEEIPWWRAPMPLKLKSGLGNILGRLFGIRIAVMRRG
jgi:N-acetylglutamate synthase-like GNAT family acetyltransferase